MNSLSARLLSIMSLWLVVALVVTGLLLSTQFKQNAERNFQGLLLAHAYNLMGVIESEDGTSLSGNPDLGDPRFLSPAAGWYWAVVKASAPSKPLLHSLSITNEDLVVPEASKQPFDPTFRRTYTFVEDYGASVQRLEAQLYFGDGDSLFQVIVAGNRDELEEAANQFNRQLLMFFLTFGIGTLVATFLAVRLGLRPLRQAKQALIDVREGRKERLEGQFPIEIDPLASEVNALIAANKSVTERARTQVGNLAHALKTPLAVIQNEVRTRKDSSNSIVGQQAQLMQSQIGTYLNRARIAAQKGAISARTEVVPVVEDLLRVMRKLSPDVVFRFTQPENTVLLFQGEKQDLEEVLGNLLENASRFTKNEVSILLETTSNLTRPQFAIKIDDDGPGLSASEIEEALKRGKRLDETLPGSGLGLSIVRDIADEYDGELKLERNDKGGLSVAVFLPRIAVK